MMSKWQKVGGCMSAVCDCCVLNCRKPLSLCPFTQKHES